MITSTSPLPLWKREISSRVQAHRHRRQVSHLAQAAADVPPRRSSPRTAGVAASVAERYAAAPSYSQYLARLTGTELSPTSMDAGPLNLSPTEDLFQSDNAEFATQGSSALDLACEPIPAISNSATASSLARAVFPPGLELPVSALMSRTTAQNSASEVRDASEPAVIEPDAPIAPKLIEFPRQIIAPRRARPRLAEGPLRESPASQEVGAQLRIFEVEAEQISTVPSPPQPAQAHEAAIAPAAWHYIRLDAPLLSSPARNTATSQIFPDAAPLHRRALAACLDFGLIAFGFLIFAVGFIAVTSQPPSGWFSLISAAVVFSALLFGYQWLFFNYSGATPGMRYARIALCTFRDTNPTPRQRQARIAATFIAIASAGLGFAWMCLDPDRLGWHDRISRTYQRCY